jgi:hypothetical protein
MLVRRVLRAEPCGWARVLTLPCALRQIPPSEYGGTTAEKERNDARLEDIIRKLRWRCTRIRQRKLPIRQTAREGEDLTFYELLHKALFSEVRWSGAGAGGARTKVVWSLCCAVQDHQAEVQSCGEVPGFHVEWQ